MKKYFRVPLTLIRAIGLKQVLFLILLGCIFFIAAANLLLSSIFQEPASEHLIYSRIISVIAISLIGLSIATAVYSIEKHLYSIRKITGELENLYEEDLPYSEKHDAPEAMLNLISSLNRISEDVRSNFNALSNERDTLSSLLETMTDGVILVNDSKIEIINNSAYQMLGIEEISADSNSFMDIVRDHEINSILDEAVETGSRVEADILFNQTNKIVHVISSPGTEANRKKVLLTLHDLTESRHIDLTRREFVSNVSHELRTPLASIKAIVESLESGAIQDEKYASDFLHRIHSTVDSMNDLVSDLLILSKAESDTENTETDIVDVGAAAQFSLNTLGDKAAQKHVSLSINAKASPALVKANETQIEIVFTNLIDNAIKFSEEGGEVWVDIDLNNNMVAASVRDNGVGINSEDIDRIFERFYKAERSRHNEGTGLGLSIVRHIIESFGGSIEVKSNVGEGSLFSFELPRFIETESC
ncbi:MAG: ATP-binding protein [Chloroflexota bacterium]|nr:ATP-binding protein [Chloroflexota bacterium]